MRTPDTVRSCVDWTTATENPFGAVTVMLEFWAGPTVCVVPAARVHPPARAKIAIAVAA
jgi:hypothetical protein